MNWQNVPSDFFSEKVQARFGKIKPVPTENMKDIFGQTSRAFATMEHPIRNTAVEYDMELRREIIRATPRPLYIREMATRITKNLFRGEKYSFLHWRYDRNDFLKHCGKNGGWDSCPLYEKVSTDPKQFRKVIVRHFRIELCSKNTDCLNCLIFFIQYLLFI